MKRRLVSVIAATAAAVGVAGLAIGQTPPAPTPQSRPEVAACLDAGKPAEGQIAKCDTVLASLQPTDPDYGPLAIALMQMYADGGKRGDALRYGDMLAATKTGVDALVTQCVVRVIVKWDLETGLRACSDVGAKNAAALEARGQIHLLAGKWQDAWSDFDAAFKLDGAGQALYLRGLAAAAQGRMGDGLKDMADGEAKAPGSAQAYERDGYSLSAVSSGKPLASPEAFAAAVKTPASKPQQPGVVVATPATATSRPQQPGVVVATPATATSRPQQPGVVVATPATATSKPQQPGVVVATPATATSKPQQPGVVVATPAIVAPKPQQPGVVVATPVTAAPKPQQPGIIAAIPATAPSVVAAAGPASMPRFEPDAPMGAPKPLNTVQIQACEDDVRALQEESKGWQGTIDEAALKIGMLQRTIYASRCAGHPMAVNLIAGAERMITDAAPRAATAATTAEQTTPVVTDCVEPIPAGDARNLTASSVFRNTCSHPVTVTYCNITPVKGSWAESFACERKTSIALMSIPAKSSAPAVFGREINHFACKNPAMPVATYTPGGGLQGFCK